MGSHDDQAARFELVQPVADEVPEPASHLVAHHSVADTSADYETNLGRLVLLVTDEPGPVRGGGAQLVHHQSRPRRARAATHRATKVVGTTEPVVSRQHEGQAVSRTRPLERRDLTTERPARVRMRTRKPCVLARLRLLG